MATTYIRYPANSSGSGIPTYANFAALPASAVDGSAAITLDNDSLYIYNAATTSWKIVANPSTILGIGTIDSGTPSANGASESAANLLILQSASATVPGLINTGSQTIAGSKTLTGILNANGGIDRSTAGTLTIGATNSTTINIGNSGATVNIQGTTIYENTPQLLVADPLITVNSGGAAGSGQNAGIQVEEAASITGYVETSSDRNSWILKAPNTAGIATITAGASGITLDQSSHNPVTLGTANGLSLSTQVLSLQAASTSLTGALTSADWNTFNNKQDAGNYITALTGDATAAGPSSAALTLATVNSNVGTFGAASQVGVFTANAKGLITAAANLSIQIAESQVTNLVSDLAGKQPTGNYLTALTGDATAAGPGSAALTLATVNSNVGSFGSASQVAGFTVNAKGLITAASNTAIAISGSAVSGGTFGAVNGSALTALNASNLATGTAAVGVGGTGQTSYTNGQLLIGNTSGNTLTKATLTAGAGISITNGNGSITIANTAASATPTVQRFLTGSGTYTLPASVRYIRVRASGGGGAGASSGGGGHNGAAGGNTTFGSSLLTANGGAGGTFGSSAGGAGGTATVAGPAVAVIAVSGGSGQGGENVSANSYTGGMGGANPLGGAGGTAGGGNGGTSSSGAANTGGGGGGAGATGVTTTGAGGGAGGYLEAIIDAPSATYAYAVGAGGAANNTGANSNAGDGGSGVIVVEEFY